MKTIVYLVPGNDDPKIAEFFHDKVRRRINELYYSRGYIKRGVETVNDLMDGIILTGENPDMVVIIKIVGYDGYDLPGIIKLREVCRKNGIELIERY